MIKYVIPTTLLLAAFGVAQAQQGWTEIEDDEMLVPQFEMTVDELDGMTLYDSAGERIGELDDILMGTDGSTMAASLDVGGFLGIGEKDVVVPLEGLQLSEDGLMTSMTKDELEALPEYDD